MSAPFGAPGWFDRPMDGGANRSSMGSGTHTSSITATILAGPTDNKYRAVYELTIDESTGATGFTVNLWIIEGATSYFLDRLAVAAGATYRMSERIKVLVLDGQQKSLGMTVSHAAGANRTITYTVHWGEPSG